MSLSEHRKKEIQSLNPEQRLKHFVKHVKEHQQIWILVDEHGAVMMTTDDEDCIPVWPNEEFALDWATDEWAGFEAKAITVKDWKSKWTRGLDEDELAIVVFPLPKDDGVVLSPDELAYELA